MKKIFLLTMVLGILVFPVSVRAATSFPKPFPLSAQQKRDPLYSPYGVVVYHNQKEEDAMNYEKKDRVYRLLAEAGVKWIRLTVLAARWSRIEPQKGSFNWSALDSEIQLAGNYGLRILGTPPSPCSKEQNGAYFELCRATDWHKFVPDWWNGDDEDFQNIVKAFVDRYSTPVGGSRKIQHWMNFNEWNGEENFVSADYFTRYFRMTSEILKTKSANLKLSAPFLGSGLIGEATGAPGSLGAAFSPPNSVGQYHDFLAFHKYANYNQMDDRNKAFINGLKALATFKYTPAYNVANKSVWVTEGGYGCNITPGTVCDAEGERLQADDLQKRYWIALHPADYGVDSRLKIEKVFWFKDISQNNGFGVSAQNPMPPEWGSSGLIRDDTYQPRKAYSAYKEMALWYTPPGTPQLTTPANNATVWEKPVFSWQAPSNMGSEGFRRYTIQVDNDHYFTSPVSLEHTNPWGFGYSTTTSYQSKNAIPAGSYFWRVKVEDAKGNFGSWTPPRTIAVGNDHPAQNPADLTDEGDTPGDEVNFHDYNVLLTGFGTSYDIFDYNELVERWGE